MPLESPQIWKDTFSKLPEVNTKDWAANVANWLGERTTSKLQLMPILGPVTFSFQSSTFESELRSLTEVDKSQTGALNYGKALETALMASKMTVTPGCCLVAPAPPTIWTVVTTMIDTPSIQSAKQKLVQELSSASAVDKSAKSSVAEAFRNAFMMITCSVTGMNATAPPGPLVSPFTPVC